MLVKLFIWTKGMWYYSNQTIEFGMILQHLLEPILDFDNWIRLLHYFSKKQCLLFDEMLFPLLVFSRFSCSRDWTAKLGGLLILISTGQIYLSSSLCSQKVSFFWSYSVIYWKWCCCFWIDVFRLETHTSLFQREIL